MHISELFHLYLPFSFKKSFIWNRKSEFNHKTYPIYLWFLDFNSLIKYGRYNPIMLLKIKTTHTPATDLGYLLQKHPAKFQTKDLSFGKAHIFYPEANASSCTAALLLDINSVKLARSREKNYSGSFQLDHYVNDRPYTASSFMTTAIAKVYGSALNGKCKDKPELVNVEIPLEAELSVVTAKAGESLIKKLFEPLGYEVIVQGRPFDEKFPVWGESPYYHVRLSQKTTLQLLLSHLFVLLPALDNNKHYYIGEAEIEKLIAKGGEWLKSHPSQKLIVNRYLKHRKSFAREALKQLVGETEINTEEKGEKIEAQLEEKISLHETRLQAVTEQLKISGAKSVIDLGCGGGKLLRYLIKVRQFEKIVGMDVSYRSLEVAKRRLYYDNMAPKMQERIQLIHSALTYRDARIEGFDAVALVEVIEHLDATRLEALEKVVFGCAKPKTLIITTPNREYNMLFENMAEGSLRHPDHRFEWTRKEFNKWGDKVAEEYEYTVEYFPLGEEHETYGAPSQMGVFKFKN